VQITIKWLFDRTAALVGLIVLSPLLAVVSLLIRLTLGPPVLFRQRRPGLHAHIFTLYKFRTMRTATDALGRPLPDAERLTPLGKALRKTSIDELPQLLNVLKGDMSLVGPRPLLVDYLPLYTPQQARRHDVRPGITGLAQVNGRNNLSWEKRFALDVYYADHWSLALDLRIIARTVLCLLHRRGVNQEGHATARPFAGSQP
jgi:sugar transferase EpsL